MLGDNAQAGDAAQIIADGWAVNGMVHDVRIHGVVRRIARLPGGGIIGNVVGLAQHIAQEDIGMGVNIRGHVAGFKGGGSDET